MGNAASKPTWTVNRPCPGKIKLMGEWGDYWLLVNGDVRHLWWKVGRGERILAQYDDDTTALPLATAQTMAEEAVREFIAFDNYDPNARWKDA